MMNSRCLIPFSSFFCVFLEVWMASWLASVGPANQWPFSNDRLYVGISLELNLETIFRNIISCLWLKTFKISWWDKVCAQRAEEMNLTDNWRGDRPDGRGWVTLTACVKDWMCVRIVSVSVVSFLRGRIRRFESLCSASCSDFVCEIVCLGFQMTDMSCCLGLLNMTPVWLNASEWK